MQGNVNLKGSLQARLIRGSHYRPAPLSWKLRNWSRPSFIWGLLVAWLGWQYSKLTGVPVMTGQLSARLFKAGGEVVDYGVVSYRSVTTAFVNFVTDQLQTETSVFGDFKFHDSGVGTTAENITDTAIETTDGESRVTGTQTESAANAYRSVGTIAYTTTKAITEHGLFNDVSAGTLMDRSVFSAINVVNGDSVEFTYTLTISAGG
jgi:hypothetical protein